MKSLKSDYTLDRLSELPDCLIIHILSLLGMRDVVRTTLLSKRWKDLWTTIPCLNFSNDSLSRTYLPSFRNFVCEALALWRGVKILEFGLDFFFDPCITSDLDLWLLFAIEKRVEELHVYLIESDQDLSCYWEREYYVPQLLYSYSSIRKLSFISCKLTIDENVVWNQLESLTIEGVVSLTEHTMNQILSGAPRLEVLNLGLMESRENLNIRSTSVKMLKIERYRGVLSSSEVNNTMLRIWAPSLKTFEISGVSYGRCLLNCQSLTNASLGFRDRDYKNEMYLGSIVFEEMLRQVLLSICHVEKVTLSDWCIKVIADMKMKDMFLPFSNVKFLKLYASAANEILGVLEMFPKLMVLILLHNDVSKLLYDYHVDASNSLEPETNSPSYSLQSAVHLRTVEITWHAFDTSIIPVIKFLLDNAQMLEKMLFRPRLLGTARKSLMLLLSSEKMVLSRPRSSLFEEVITIKS